MPEARSRGDRAFLQRGCACAGGWAAPRHTDTGWESTQGNLERSISHCGSSWPSDVRQGAHAPSAFCLSRSPARTKHPRPPWQASPENTPAQNNHHDYQGNAASEDRTHDLRIMRPTRYQLRYSRLIDNTSVPDITQKLSIRYVSICCVCAAAAPSPI